MTEEQEFEAGMGDVESVKSICIEEGKPRNLGKPDGTWYPWMDEFLEKLMGLGSVGRALSDMEGNVERKRVFLHKQACRSFSEAWVKTFHKAAPEKLEESVWDRAIHGTQVPVVSKGVIIAYRVQHHDHLAEFLLKSAMPGKYMLETAIGASGSHEDTAQALIDARNRIRDHMQSLKPNGGNGDTNRLN